MKMSAFDSESQSQKNELFHLQKFSEVVVDLVDMFIVRYLFGSPC